MDLVLMEAEKLLAAWDSLSTRLLYFGYPLMGLGIACSLAIMTFTDNLKPILIKALGFVAALCTGILATLHPIDVGTAFRQAWRGLNLATIEYKANNDANHGAAVVNAIKKGEVIIEAAQGRVPVDLGGGYSPGAKPASAPQ